MISFYPNVLLVGITMIVLCEFEEVKTEPNVKHTFLKMLKNIIVANERRMDALKKITELEDYVMTKTSTQYIDGNYGDDREPSEDHSTRSEVAALIDIIQDDSTLRRAIKLNNQFRATNDIILVPVKINNMKDDKFVPSADGAQSKVNDYSKEVKELSGNMDDSEYGQFNVESSDDRNVDLSVKDQKVNSLLNNLRRSSWMSSCAKKAAKVCIRACRSAASNFFRSYSVSSRARRKLKMDCKRCCKAKFSSSNRYSDTE